MTADRIGDGGEGREAEGRRRHRGGEEVLGLPAGEAARRCPAVKNAAGCGTRSTRSSWRSSKRRACKPVTPGRPRGAGPAGLLRPTGLPPTPEEVDAFVNDTSPDAYEKLIDKLLASPALRREVGPALARRRPLRRDQRLRARRPQAVRLALPRLRHPALQRRQAVRPVRQGATRRRRDARLQPGRGHRHRLLPARHLGRRAGRPAAGAVRRATTTSSRPPGRCSSA